MASSDARQLDSLGLGSLLGSLPIIGPILAPLLPLLGAIGLSEASASTQDATSLTADQLEALADIESLLFEAAHEVTAGLPDAITPANATLQARGLLPLGSILTGLPIIGPFLLPLLPLLDSIGLASVDASPEAVNAMSLNEDQTSKLAHLKAILEEDVPDLMPENDDHGDGASAPTPSGVSPAANPTPTAGAAEDSSSTTPSAVSPEAETPCATPTPTAGAADNSTPTSPASSTSA